MTATAPRIAFMGTPEFAAVALRALCANGYKPVAVYTQPPRPAGRGQQLQKSPVQLFAESQSIPVMHPINFKSDADRAEFASHNLDIAIVAAYGLLLPQAILDAPKLGCVNIHASLLPRWRGAAPIQRAIEAGDAETGIAIMQMDAGLDTGPVFTMERIAIGKMNAGQLHDAMAGIGGDLMARTLPQILLGAIAAKPQPADGATYAAKIKKEETRIDWRMDATAIERKIRALAPAPGAYFEYNGERIKILSAEICGESGAAGTILQNGLIACGHASIRPLQLQRAGKTIVTASEFWRSGKIKSGEIL